MKKSDLDTLWADIAKNKASYALHHANANTTDYLDLFAICERVLTQIRATQADVERAILPIVLSYNADLLGSVPISIFAMFLLHLEPGKPQL